MTKNGAFFVLLLVPAALAAQQTAVTSRAAELIGLARDQIRANRADSALALLKVAADSATGGSVGDREQALVLLGFIEYVAHRDSSATALAFRRALQLDPGLQAGGLAQVDSALERILVAERQALTPDPPLPARRVRGQLAVRPDARLRAALPRGGDQAGGDPAAADTAAGSGGAGRTDAGCHRGAIHRRRGRRPGARVHPGHDQYGADADRPGARGAAGHAFPAC